MTLCWIRIRPSGVCSPSIASRTAGASSARAVRTIPNSTTPWSVVPLQQDLAVVVRRAGLRLQDHDVDRAAVEPLQRLRHMLVVGQQRANHRAAVPRRRPP